MRRWDRMTFLFAPKGPKQSSPGGGNPACGVGPGNLGTTLLRALKGRNGGDITRTFACTALSGLAVGANSPSLLPFPGRCPGLICLGPFGASSSQGGSPTEVSRRGLVARFHAFPVVWAYLVKMARRTTLAQGGSCSICCKARSRGGACRGFRRRWFVADRRRFA